MTPELEALRAEYRMKHKNDNAWQVEIFIMIGLIYLIWRILV